MWSSRLFWKLFLSYAVLNLAATVTFVVIVSGWQQDQAQHKTPDVIVLDLMLPVIDGLEVCRRLRSSPTTRDVLIVMLTAKSEESDQVPFPRSTKVRRQPILPIAVTTRLEWNDTHGDLDHSPPTLAHFNRSSPCNLFPVARSSGPR